MEVCEGYVTDSCDKAGANLKCCDDRLSLPRACQQKGIEPQGFAARSLLAGAFTIQNVISRLLRLSGGGYHHALVAAEFGEPALNIRGLILQDGGRNSRLGAQISG